MTQPPSPEGSPTNARPYLIFWSYMGTCLLLCIFIIARLAQNATALRKSKTALLPPAQHVRLFAALAAGSLLTTWGFMIRYFQSSYQDWFMSRSHFDLDPQQKHWGLWLRETSLFREAWETVIVGETRYWWSHQIFFFALGLGLYLEQKGVRRGITYTWAFMLLGQIVAISVATNLFLLTVLLSPPLPPASPSTTTTRSPKWLSSWLITLLSIIATVIPAWLLTDAHYWHSPSFMPVLLTPHAALMILPLARIFFPTRSLSGGNTEFLDKAYNRMWQLVLGTGALMLVKTTANAYAVAGFQGIWTTLLGHPAVSSVGFDVIFCWVSWVCWWMLRGGESTGERTMDSVGKLSRGLDEGVSTAVSEGSVDAGTRRR
ncbi:hypothetical protein P153DRAFT_422310 [Dothidotthia symphoricarpi CBS 119687]|uniref:Uncharacterized protein n=1 Tax=Dothidotthia symphoricarpi CBS 119687 TaxID=1392245 RepID=A0A6A6AIX8_9PLEO|nr:uncharacterized protein P153DRAFT_422310 [Dothidotthia symphoricarpi CBS 119687]KAF2130391.1 hypothetical protein P153DRAFT_422310 [Dothidotthia symphoricarpi CBS 119687]